MIFKYIYFLLNTTLSKISQNEDEKSLSRVERESSGIEVAVSLVHCEKNSQHRIA